MESPAFSLDIAEVIFGSDVSAVRARSEERVIDRFKEWFDKASKDTIHQNCAGLDRALIGRLSGPSMLKVARMIEARCPEVIVNMPLLNQHFAQLKRAHTMAQVFMPNSLKMLVQALESEGET